MVRRIVAGPGRAVLAIGLAIALLLGGAGCAGRPSPAVTPLVVRIVDIQSATIRVRLNQVIRVDTRGLPDRYTPLIADDRIVTVVVRRDEATGRFEPEIVPRRVGTTQVALIGSSPLETTGFKVIVTP